MKATKAEVAEYISNFLTGQGKTHEWDYFISVPIDNDRELDAIGLICARLPEIYPPTEQGTYTSKEGLQVLQRLLTYLQNNVR